MKIISWNVNGIRAAQKKGFEDTIRDLAPDILCIQETKAQDGQSKIDLPEYKKYWNSAEKKGYSGTAIFSKTEPIRLINDITIEGERLENLIDDFGNANTEGRVVTAEYEKSFIVSVYTPNSKRELKRLDFRHKFWDPAFLSFVKELEKNKPVVFCGDLNVAHTEIDLARPDTNHNNHGFTDEERSGFDKIIEAGFIDTYRYFYKEGGVYTWWSPFAKSRERNVGWRIDYICVSSSLREKLQDAYIYSDVTGSDHCPVGIKIDL